MLVFLEVLLLARLPGGCRNCTLILKPYALAIPTPLGLGLIVKPDGFTGPTNT